MIEKSLMVTLAILVSTLPTPPVWSQECAWVKTFEKIPNSVLLHSLLSSLNPVSENKGLKFYLWRPRQGSHWVLHPYVSLLPHLGKGQHVPQPHTSSLTYFPPAPYLCLLSSLLPSTSPQPIFLPGALIFSQNAELLPSKPLQHLGPFCMSITQKHPHAVPKIICLAGFVLYLLL